MKCVRPVIRQRHFCLTVLTADPAPVGVRPWADEAAASVTVIRVPTDQTELRSEYRLPLHAGIMPGGEAGTGANRPHKRPHNL